MPTAAPLNDATSVLGNSWAIEARAIQQTLHSNFRDREWSFYKHTEHVHLVRNVGFALFGPPDDFNRLDRYWSNETAGFTAKKLEVIKKVLQTIKNNDNHVKMSQESISIRASSIFLQHTQRKALKSKLPSVETEQTCEAKDADEPKRNVDGIVVSVIFVVLEVVTENDERRAVPEPVFRVPNESYRGERCKYIDRHSNVYNGWKDYLKRNKLPPGRYCYPVRGVYNADAANQVQVEVGETPASQSQKTSCMTMISQSLLYFKFANTIMMMPTDDHQTPMAIDGISLVESDNGLENLFTVTPNSSVPRIDNSDDVTWQCLDANNLGLIAMGAGFSDPGRSQTVNSLKITPKTTNCYGVVTAAHVLHGKLKRYELTDSDVAQFAACVLFFTMSAIGEVAARKVIEEASEEMVNSLRSKTRSQNGGKRKDGARSSGVETSITSTFNPAKTPRFTMLPLKRGQHNGPIAANVTAALATPSPTQTGLYRHRGQTLSSNLKRPSDFESDFVNLNLIGWV